MIILLFSLRISLFLWIFSFFYFSNYIIIHLISSLFNIFNHQSNNAQTLQKCQFKHVFNSQWKKEKCVFFNINIHLLNLIYLLFVSYGSLKVKYGSDYAKPFDSCSICLHRVVNPVSWYLNHQISLLVIY